jgi:hypothetical protein
MGIAIRLAGRWSARIHSQVSRPPEDRYHIEMKDLPAFILAAFIAALAASPALAHRPYFTQVEKIRLPNGEMGEARLLNGDGIFGPDPVRVLLLDAGGRLLARSQKSVLMALSCTQGQCLIFDLYNNQVLDLEPSSFRQGAPVPGAEERDDLWHLEDGEETWGFARRNPTPGERLRSYGVLVQKSPLAIAINVLVGMVCALIILVTLRLGKMKRTRVFQTAAAIIGVLALISGSLFLILLSGFASFLDGLSMTRWLGLVGMGAGALPLGLRIARALRGQPRTA